MKRNENRFNFQNSISLFKIFRKSIQPIPDILCIYSIYGITDLGSELANRVLVANLRVSKEARKSGRLFGRSVLDHQCAQIARRRNVLDAELDAEAGGQEDLVVAAI